jgi:hypothetical protein
MRAFTTRSATPDDAEGAAHVLAAAFRGRDHVFSDAKRAASAAGFALLLQTGHAFLVAEDEGVPAGVVRIHEDEGILWFDLLASCVPGAGRELARAVDRLAQDRGIRLVRTALPDTPPLTDVLQRWGYLPVARRKREIEGNIVAELVLEKRVPLLTVREQRRTDADAIASLAGVDPWPLAQGARPGWFVLADGDRVAGVISVRTGRDGVAEIAAPVLARGYGGRGLELWMLERAATFAETNGAHTARTAVIPAFSARERELEFWQWFREDEEFVRRFRGRPLTEAREEDW